MLKAFLSITNYLLLPKKNDDKLEINSEPTSQIDNEHLELRKEERR